MLCLAGAALFSPVLAAASVPPAPVDTATRGSDIQRRQEQELEVQRERASQRPDVLSTPAASSSFSDTLRFPDETPCFPLHDVFWDGAQPGPVLRRMAQAAVGACVGGQGLMALQKHLTAALIAQGLITARVLVPEQSLSGGRLFLRYVPGRVAAVNSEGAIGWWGTALPAGPGGELNQRDLDQALENIRRLSGQQDATIDIAPGPALGDSDILIRPGTGKRWHGYLGGDNSGIDSIGRYQINAGLTLDSPLFLYDQLSVAWNSNARWRDAGGNTRAASANYNVPFGYWTLFAGASKSTYRQTVAGFVEPILYGGTTKQWQAGVSVVPYRGPAYKGHASFTLLRKRSDSTLNDVPIEVQRRDVVGYDVNVGHRHYLGRAVLDLGGGVRGTLPQLSEQPGYVFDDPEWDGRSTIVSANAGLYLPFSLAGQAFAYQGNWQIQHAKTPITPPDYFTIGNRYAVRGFDGQVTLAAEDGWTLRNDVSLNLEGLAGLPGQQAYTGLDFGRVGGPSARFLSGRTLVGAVAGLRGRYALPHINASYDISAGWPLAKPDSLKTASTTFALAVMLEF